MGVIAAKQTVQTSAKLFQSFRTQRQYLDSESMGGSVRGKPKSNPKTETEKELEIEPETKLETNPNTNSEQTCKDRLRNWWCFGSGKDDSKKPDEHQKDDPKVGSDAAADNGVKESEELL